MIELVDEGNGYLSIYCTNIDHNATEDSLAHRARALAAARRASGVTSEPADLGSWWATDVASQNLLIRIPLASEVAAELGRHDWPSRIESEATLLEL